LVGFRRRCLVRLRALDLLGLGVIGLVALEL
jgi:hypothetical protein